MRKIRITAQYCENYCSHNENWDGKKEGWKNKGGEEFVATVSDDIFSDTETIIAVSKNVLAKKSNLVVKYEFVDFERIYQDPEDITKQFSEECDSYLKSEVWIDPAGGVHSADDDDPSAMYV